MSKRLTDAKKWRTTWFRTLPLKAKIVWSYLCDECEYYGVWKADFDLASFQVNFSFDKNDLKEWFGEKVYFFGDDRILIVPFFEFQYSEVKDSWNAKANARKKLENFGFTIIDNQVQIPTVGDSGGTVEDSHPTVHININIKDNIKSNNKGDENFKICSDAYLTLQGVTLGSNAEKRFHEQIKTPEDVTDLLNSIQHYKDFLAFHKNAWRRPKTTFETYLGTKSSGFFWRDWINPPANSTPPEEDYSSLNEIFKDAQS